MVSWRPATQFKALRACYVELIEQLALCFLMILMVIRYAWCCSIRVEYRLIYLWKRQIFPVHHSFELPYLIACMTQEVEKPISITITESENCIMLSVRGHNLNPTFETFNEILDRNDRYEKLLQVSRSYTVGLEYLVYVTWIEWHNEDSCGWCFATDTENSEP